LSDIIDYGFAVVLGYGEGFWESRDFVVSILKLELGCEYRQSGCLRTVFFSKILTYYSWMESGRTVDFEFDIIFKFLFAKTF
jgi:hypothetical protein